MSTEKTNKTIELMVGLNKNVVTFFWIPPIFLMDDYSIIEVDIRSWRLEDEY